MIDYFLEIDGIPGESTAIGFERQIDVVRWSWEQAFQPGAKDESEELPPLAVGPFRMTKALDKATPKLMLACASRKLLPWAILTCSRTGERSDLLRVTLTNLKISSYSATGVLSSLEPPHEEIGMTFERIEFESTELRSDGTAAGVIRSGWDVRADQSC